MPLCEPVLSNISSSCTTAFLINATGTRGERWTFNSTIVFLPLFNSISGSSQRSVGVFLVLCHSRVARKVWQEGRAIRPRRSDAQYLVHSSFPLAESFQMEMLIDGFQKGLFVWPRSVADKWMAPSSRAMTWSDNSSVSFPASRATARGEGREPRRQRPIGVSYLGPLPLALRCNARPGMTGREAGRGGRRHR